MPGDSWWDPLFKELLDTKFSLFKELLDTKFSNIDERFAATNKALELQAREYSRRLEDLNHAHQRALDVQHTFVSLDKYEDRMKSEEQARKIALERLDERIASVNRNLSTKLDDYITKAEARQAELDQTIASQKGAAEEAARAAEKQGRESALLAQEAARKTNRNMAIMGLVLTVIIAISNYIGNA